MKTSKSDVTENKRNIKQNEKMVSICMNDWKEILKDKRPSDFMVMSFVFICPDFLVFLHLPHLYFPSFYRYFPSIVSSTVFNPVSFTFTSSCHQYHECNSSRIISRSAFTSIFLPLGRVSIQWFYFCLAWIFCQCLLWVSLVFSWHRNRSTLSFSE